MNQFVADHPALGPLWDAGKNAEPASAVSSSSFKAAWWACARGHAGTTRGETKAPISRRCRRLQQVGQPRPTRGWHAMPESGAEMSAGSSPNRRSDPG